MYLVEFFPSVLELPVKDGELEGPRHCVPLLVLLRLLLVDLERFQPILNRL